MEVAITYLIVGNKILFLYKDTRGYFVGPGGKRDEPEILVETAKREFAEETGIEIEPKLFAETSVLAGNGEEQEHFMLYSYYATEYSGEALTRTSEGEVMWKPISDIQNLPMFPGDKILLLRLLAKLANNSQIAVEDAKIHYNKQYTQIQNFLINGIVIELE